MTFLVLRAFGLFRVVTDAVAIRLYNGATANAIHSGINGRVPAAVFCLCQLVVLCIHPNNGSQNCPIQQYTTERDSMTPTSADVQNKVILITGGAQGIGGETARLCAQRGAEVIITDIKTETGEALAASLRAEGCKARFLPLDVRRHEDAQRVFHDVQERHGRLDVLICSAGVLKAPMQLPDVFPVEVFDDVMAVNVRGIFLCVKEAFLLLEASARGVLLLVGSGAGVQGGSSSLAYGTSKGAVNGMGMTLENHLAPKGIRVNVVCPGSIETELKLRQMRESAEALGQPFDLEDARTRLGDPEGVAALLAFLASDDARYVRRNLFTR